MTPQEAQRVAELFDRLASLEGRPRDAEAEHLIAESLQRAPNAIYALVQAVLVQDEALRNADARIRALEAAAEPQGGGFLDSMRDTLFGGERPRSSVPPVRPQGAPMGVPPGFGSGPVRMDNPPPPPQAPQQGGSFLGTAAAAAAGVIGGSLLLDSIRSMMGGQRHTMADTSGSAASPWGGSNPAQSDLAKDAGLNDIGQSGNRQASETQNETQGLYDTAEADVDEDDGDFDSDFDLGDSDFA
jgi:hypothetical protein